MVYKIYNELLQLKTSNPIKTGLSIWISISSSDHTNKWSVNMKNSSTSLIIRERQIKSHWDIISHLSFWGNDISSFVEMQNSVARMEKSTKVSQKLKNKTTLWSSNITFQVFIQKNCNHGLKQITALPYAALLRKSRFRNNFNVHQHINE